MDQDVNNFTQNDNFNLPFNIPNSENEMSNNENENSIESIFCFIYSL